MPSTTTNYGLALYNSSTDQTENFLDYRTAIAGISAASNMSIIDSAMNDNAVAITALEARKNIIAVSATLDSPNTYISTVSSISSYDTDQVIALKLDTDSNGTVTLNINSLGAKNVMKVSSAGAYVNLDGSDMRAEREYNCKYDGTRYVWMDATSADQINIEGTAGNIATVATDNSLEEAVPATIRALLSLEDADITTLAQGVSIDNVVEDTTPQLGGDLDLNSNNISFVTGETTPTPVAVTNVSATATCTIRYIRTGNFVLFTGKVNITPTASATLTEIRIPLPIASTFTLSTLDASGNCVKQTTTSVIGTVFADITNDELKLRFVSEDTANNVYTFDGKYQII